MPPLSLLIKPASSNCNLRCKYCFYQSIAETRNIKSYGIMNTETLEIIVKKFLDYAEHECTFAFQGGEPTIVGLKFYEKLLECQKKYNYKRIKINNALQTNGMLIDDEWAKFLANNNFLVGISLDGPKDINDANRVDPDGKGSFNAIMKTVDLFNKYGVEFNILSVVNAYVADHADKEYNFFKKHDFRYLQFIPCLDPIDVKPGSFQHSLTPDKYAKFLKTLFNRWYNDVINGEQVSIRFFDNLVRIVMGYKPEACGMQGRCSCQFVVEADGSTYPCDFYVTDEWYLGNIKDKDPDELKNSEAGKKFIEVSKHIDPKCRECKWFTLCRGGCRRYREPFVDGKPHLNFFCTSYMEFFEYSSERLYKLSMLLSSNKLRLI
ncbi:MAG TPA: anaerobic sulfatase maturase [Thermoanaerobacterales bacterium]|nr:anaerobic sulfatase maturase [Thermoanaerobacterales bacterium]